MKCVIAFSCLLAVASAGYLNSAVGYGAYDDGSYKGEAFNHGVYGGAYSGALGYASHGSHAVAYNAPIVSAHHAVGHAYAGPYAHGYAHAAPIAVAHSGSHAVAYNAPLVSAPHPVNIGYAGALAHAYAAHTGPVAHGYAHAAPVAHGYAHAAPIAHGYAHGYAHATPVAHGYAHGYAHAAPIAHGYAHAAPLALASEARLVDPVAIAAGAPLPTGDTVEVAAAKAFHHQAHVEAKTGHLLAKGHYLVKRSPGYLNAGYAGYAAPLAYAAAPAYGYAQSHGVSAYASPLAYSGYSGYGYGGHVGAYYG